MLNRLGEKFTYIFLKYMPNAFVFAIILTLFTAFIALVWMNATPIQIVESWYKGFFDLLAFAMQIILIIITGFSIALSPIVKRSIDSFCIHIKSPRQVYFVVVFCGLLLSLVSFGWIVITSVLARELATRVKGVNYPFLVACVYFSGSSWVLGLSSSIPLLLNSENNFLISGGLLAAVIPTSLTLGSGLNLVMIIILLILAPLTMLVLSPRDSKGKELKDLVLKNEAEEPLSIKDEAKSLSLPFSSVSDRLNNSSITQYLLVSMGFLYIIYHFYTYGFDVNFNLMIFVFLIVGMLLHHTPIRYVIAMKRSSSNVSGILFQYPFYAGIMGIMLYSGLGEKLGQIMATVASIESYPFYAYITGAVVNFAIPSAGGEFAVVGPSLINAIKELGVGLAPEEISSMIVRASISVAYGESLSNLIQPFFLLIILPIMGAGVKIQARDLMGYLVLPFLLFFTIQSFLLIMWPL